MKILCAISGIEFTCEHFPLTLHARECYHPIFDVPQRKLLSCLPKWSGNELTPTDSYLLFLSLLRSSDLVEFRTSARITKDTESIVAQNMEPLVKILSRLNTVSNPGVSFPHYIVGGETADLGNAQFWIENWKDSYQEFLDGYKSFHDMAKINRKEAVLERLIKNPHKKVTEFAGPLSDWAAAAGKFPSFIISSPLTSQPTPIGEYWKIIITKCAGNISLYSIPRKDIQELLEHCEEHIPYGTIHSHHLFKILRNALDKQKNFLDFGDMDLSKTKYTILDSGSSVQDANMISLIGAAPEEEPQKTQYPKLMDYLRAKMRWEMARKAQK